ncbi:uncharacterized protein LOC133929361 [Phragmites australis]|uniref:uncharacterized protein LOC133929361 n=1 Tax=Phragmites australis TaxID=29695 RepID=UPI002D77A36E|nr:uncharacterized protein LOC133929361 [Phragmites australis]
MSDCAGSIYDKKEDFSVLLSKKDPGESPEHKHYLWMSHWTRASSSAELQNNKSCNRLEDINKGTSTRDSAILPFRFMKSTVAERVMVGVSHGGASVQHSQEFTSNMRAVAHDVCKELGTKNNEQGDQSFERSMKHKDVNLHASAVISEAYSIRKLSQLPLDFQKLGSSDNLSSDWSHFPMFDINRKIDNILNPKRRSALDPASLNVNMSTCHVMALSSQEYGMHSHQIADENMDICKPAGAIVSDLEDPAGLSSDPSGKKLKRHLLDTMSCSCSKDGNDSSNCLIDEQHTSHYFANSKHEPPYASSEKKFKFVGNKKNQIAASAFHNQKSRTSAVHKQQDATGVMYCAPLLGREFQNEPTNCSNIVSSSLLPYEQPHLKTQRMESAKKFEDTYMLPDPITNTLTVNSNGEPWAHGKESTEKSTGSCKLKGPCLFERLTIPSKSQSAYPKKSASSGKSSGFRVCMYGTNIGSRLFGAQNQSSAKTETLYSDTLIVSESSAGIASLSAQKEYGCPNEAKIEQLATQSMEKDTEYSKENRFQNASEHHDVSFKAANASKQESCMPRTGSTNLDLIPFQTGRVRNRISSGIVQTQVSTQPSDRWLKRLQINISDPEIPCSKRSKVGDSLPLREATCLFGMTLHCDKDDAEMVDRFKEDQVLGEGSKLQDKQEIPPVPAKSMNRWIGRWCQGGTPLLHEDPGQGRQATKPDQASEELGGQFPSIAAMAMMGRAMNKLRPCEHHQKGPLVVWKTE